ncbi:MAG: BamA/TamA family outer membrane protein [Candidatus Manganitrophus sp.]|nr:BamA/TamA family outer membrane protein [Candidatus Manganitrophus sp.]
MIILLLPLLLLISNPIHAAASPEYDIVAAYSEEEHRIYGSEKISFTNDGDEPLSELYLFLYPNLYLERDPDIDQNLYKRAYPVDFNPGEQIITSIQDLKGQNLPYFPELFKKRILMKIRLPTPIPPGRRFEFLVHFITVIPEKYGIFGRNRDLVSLQGGWHPYLPPFSKGNWDFLLPPPVSRFQIRFTLNEHFDLLASAPLEIESQEGSDTTYLMKADRLPYFSLSIGKTLAKKEKKIGEVDLVYHFLPRDRDYAEQAMKTARKAVSHFLKHSGPLPPTRLQLAESYLYQDLVSAGSKLLYMNNRLFKVFPLLKRFHEASIARGIFLLLWQERLPWEESWLIEGMADLESERFIREQYGSRPSLEKWLKPVSFIPIVDEILYSRDLPFRQTYFKERVAPILNEDIQFFNHPRPEGTTIFSKLGNLVGHETVKRAVEDYAEKIQAGKKIHFREVLYRISGRKIDWFFEQWLMSSPALDFGIDKIEREKIEEGYRTTLTIKKHGDGVEPLEILAIEKNGSRIPLRWEGDREKHQEVLITPSPISVIELDPEKDSSDPNRLNNRDPRLWKILLNRYGISYNFNTGTLSYKAGLLFQPVYDNKNRIGFDFSHKEEGNASSIEFSHIFKNNHTLTLGLSYEGPQTPKDKPPEEPAGTVHVGYSLSYPNIPLLANLNIQRLTGRFPKFNINLGYDQRFTGGKYENLFQVTLDLRRVFSFSNYHEFAGRFLVGQSFGSLFENSRFFLGGDEGMRGFTPLRFEGDNIALISVEHRFPLVYDSDINLAGLALTHTLQGALFADTGMVTDSHNVFQFDEYEADVGAGIRWHVDTLGFYPIIFRFDVAIPIGSTIKAEKKPHYYIAAGFPF